MNEKIAIIFAHGFSGDDLDAICKSRLDKGVESYNKKLFSHFIVTAAHTNSKGKPLYELSKEYLLKNNVPETAILCEKHAFSTWHEIRNVYSILDKFNPSEVFLVSSEWDRTRVVEVFKSFYGSKYVFTFIPSDLNDTSPELELSEKNKLIRDLSRIKGKDGLYLLPASEKDSKDIFDWRTDAYARQQFFHTEEIDFKDHDVWFKRKLEDPLSRIYMIKKDNDSVGMIRLDNEEGKHIISINMNPTSRGKGYGSLGLALLSFEFPPGTILHAEVKNSNVPSLKLFSSQGFSVIIETPEKHVFEKTV